LNAELISLLKFKSSSSQSAGKYKQVACLILYGRGNIQKLHTLQFKHTQRVIGMEAFCNVKTWKNGAEIAQLKSRQASAFVIFLFRNPMILYGAYF